jgi:hypothetical protein
MNTLPRLLTLVFLFAWNAAAFAGDADDACTALMSARAHLLTMIGATNQTTRDNHRQKIQEASAKLDNILAGMMAGANPQEAAKAREFLVYWEAFKQTRETEIIPAIYAGKSDDTRDIAMGVQAERMKHMRSAMECRQFPQAQ